MIACDDTRLANETEDASTPLVIDLHAPWCKFCKTMEPDIRRLALEREGIIRFAELDTDEYPDVMIRYKVKTLPTVILLKDGVEIARRGSGNHEQLSQWLAEYGL